MSPPHNLFIRSKINLPFKIKENENEGSLETIEDYEWIPQKSQFKKRGEKTKHPHQAHQDRELQIDDEVNSVLLLSPSSFFRTWCEFHRARPIFGFFRNSIFLLEPAVEDSVNRHDKEKEVFHQNCAYWKNEEDHHGLPVIHPADMAGVLRSVILEVIKKTRKSVKNVGGRNDDEGETPGIVRVDLESLSAFAQGKT